VTALFCDLVGFTPLSESLDAEQVRLLQTSYFERMSGLIARYGGTVEKFAGDAVLALFGVPVAHGDDAERAVLCALDMQEAIRTLAVDVRKRWGVDLGLRIGINTGEGVSGVVDAGGRRDFSVTGDVVNTAARLQTAAEPGSVMAGQETMRLARRAVRFGDRRDLTLKGKSQSVAAYQVLEARSGVAGRALSRRLTRLVGRDHELGIVLHAWERVLDGNGALISLVADAGVGKSRLLTDAIVRIMEGGTVPQIWGRCLSYGQDLSLSLIADLLRSLLGAQDHTTDNLHALLSQRAESLLAGEDPDHQAAAVDVLGEVLGQAPGNSIVSEAGAQARRQVLVRSLRSLLAGMAASGPVVMVLDDVHWIDAASAEVLRDLLADVPGLPVLVIAASRPEWIPLWAEWTWVERLHLRPLGERDVIVLARELLGGAELEPALERYVTERAGGNPFFVEELLHALQDAGGVVQVEGVAHLVQTAAAALPLTLTEIILARLDRLEAEVRDLVQVASVIGRSFAVDLLQRVTRQSDAFLTPALSTLLQAEIAFPRPGSTAEYIFKHVTMRDVAYKTLLTRRRQELHAAIARAISALDPTDESIEIVAYHFSQTEEHAEAAAWLERAGDRSAGVFANQAAISHYEESRRRYQLSGSSSDAISRVSEKLGRVFRIIAWFDEAIEELQTAAGRYRDEGDLQSEARAMAAISEVHFARGASDQAIASVQNVLARLEWDDEAEPPPRALAGVYIAMVDPFYSLNRFEDALTVAWRAMEAARELGDERLLIEATVHYGLALQGIGRLDEAGTVLGEIIPRAEKVGDLASLAKALVWHGDIVLAQGRPLEARRSYEHAIAVDQNRGDVAETASVLVHLGHVSIILGDWPAAQSYFEQAVELVRASSYSRASTFALISLGEHYLYQGAPESAARYLEEPFTIAERSGQTSEITYLHVPLAGWDLCEGRAQAALERLEPLLREPRFETSLDHRGLQIAALAYVDQGNLPSARALAEHGMEHATGQTNLLAVLGWLPVLGAIAAAQSNEDEAERYLLEALALARDIGYRHQEGRVLQALGMLHGDGPSELEAALEIFRELGAKPDAERVERTLAPAAIRHNA
jgi:class 3 adenylate cyclase/tetratricopeptide (TPR) repeat protein